jgi:hypothetical protein
VPPVAEAKLLGKLQAEPEDPSSEAFLMQLIRYMVRIEKN